MLIKKLFGRVIVLALCMALTYLSFAQSGPADQNFTGKWIWDENNGPKNTWMCFRKSVDLNQTPSEAVAKIAVDSKYWLWVNNEMVVFEGGLKQGPTPDDSYFDEVDISSYLKVGDNTLAILVWYFGKDGFSHIDRGKGGLFFECDLSNQQVISDQSWKLLKHPAHEESTSGDQPNFRLSESNIRFNAQKDNVGNWQSENFDDTNWSNAIEKGIPPAGPWGKLWLRPIPQWKDWGLMDYVEISKSLPFTTAEKTTIRAKLPYNAQVTPFLKISAPADLVIDIRGDEYEPSNNVPSVRTEYVTKEGSQEYESLGWMSGHYIEYRVPAGVTVEALQYRETGYDTEFSGSFSCNDDFYNILWEKAQRTLYINMRDTWMDCPDRERALWWGDAVLEIGEAFYALDRKSDMLAQKCISNLIEWQKNDHSLYAPIPAGNWDRELPVQTLATVGEYGFWYYYMYTGDTATIEDAYPHVRDYLDIWEFGSDGLIKHRGGGWNFNGPWGWSDWGSNIDEKLLDNCWYYMALQAATKMAHLTKNTADTAIYGPRMRKIETNFNRTLWQGSYYKSPRYTDKVDDRGNALAVLAGLADEEKWPDIRRVLKQYTHASPYMEKYILEAQYVMGYEEDAMNRMKLEDRYASFVYNDKTTLYENFGPDGTVNHGWSGGPLTLLCQYGIGIAPEAPGFETYHVFPQEGSLTHLETVTPSVKGNIEVQIDKNSESYSLNLKSPDGTQALVGIPRSPIDGRYVQEVLVNGVKVFPAGSTAGVQYARSTDRYFVFAAEPGQYQFVANLGDKEVLATGIKSELKIYPIPVIDKLKIESPQNIESIEVYALDGKSVISKRVRSDRFHLDVSRLEAGTYLLRLYYDDGKIEERRFLK